MSDKYNSESDEDYEFDSFSEICSDCDLGALRAMMAEEEVPPPTLNDFTREVRVHEQSHTVAYYGNQAYTAERFKEMVEDYINNNPTTKSVILNHRVTRPSLLGRSDVISTSYMTLKALNFSEQFDNVSMADFKAAFGESYEGFGDASASDIGTTFVTFHHTNDDGGGSARYTQYISVDGISYRVSKAVAGLENECFFDAIKPAVGAKAIEQLKLRSGYKAGTTIKVAMIPLIVKILEKYGCPIIIKFPDTTYGANGTVVRMLLHDHHYYHVLDSAALPLVVDHDECCEAADFFAYDMMSVTDNRGTQPYMFSYAWVEDGVVKSNVMYDDDEPGSEEFRGAIEQVFHYMTVEKGLRPLSFGGSGYNDLLLMTILNHRHLYASRGNGSAINSYSYNTKRSLDLNKFLAHTLAEACASFKITGKVPDVKDFNHADLEYNDLGSVTVTTKMIDYCSRDVKVILELANKTIKLADMFGLNMRGAASIGGMVMDACRRHNTFASPGCAIAKVQMYQCVNLERHMFIRSHMIGGKCHGTPGKHKGNYKCYDITSQHPYVMMNRRFVRSVHGYIETKQIKILGFYTVIVTKNPKYVIIPHKDVERDVWDWEATPPYKTQCMGLDVMEHVRYGGEYTLIEGHCFRGPKWDTEECPMFGHLNPIAEAKMNSKDPVIRGFTKLALNAQAGKLAQLPTTHTTQISDRVLGSPDETTWLSPNLVATRREKERVGYTGSVLNGMLVQCYARQLLHAYAYQCKSVEYMDTDSLVTTTELPVGKQFGDLKLEWTADTVYVGGKKLMSAFEDGKCVKAALKGVAPRGTYDDDDEPSACIEWLQRSYEEKYVRDLSPEFNITAARCIVVDFNPRFQPVTTTIRPIFD